MVFKIIKNLSLSFFFFSFFLYQGAYSGEVEVKTGSCGGYIQKHVLSMKELRFKNLIKQKYDLSCGSAALASLLKYYYNFDINEENIIKNILKHADIKKIKARGFSMLDLKKGAERLGFKAEGYKVPFEKLSLINIPTIVLLNINNYKHFVILKGVKGNKVFLADPAYGHKVMDLSQFKKSWNGILLAVFGKRPKETVWKLDNKKVPKESIWALENSVITNFFLIKQPFEIKP
ncbi:C39 family peptidase [Thermodesulfobacterium hydrogeniphilum]|uniref:C39 family peptidase n=1 Tax=Thermodesulfobacterium hydrogeniphilum TaxID=161156 RepID=UPI00068BFCC1|nr:C39 family peptidase [Thermodesulfobacterium hydrogeniphilum]